MKNRPVFLKVVPLRLLFLGLLVIGLIFPFGQAFAYYSTPNTGVNWTLDDLVANSGGVVTGASPNYAINNTFIISHTDTLSIVPGTAITVTVNTQSVKNGVAPLTLLVLGHMKTQGTDQGPVTFTALPETPGAWHGIVVLDEGSVDMAYTKIFYAGDAAILFEDILRTAKSSKIDHCFIDQCDDDGVDLEEYDAPTFTLSNTVIRNCAENALEMEELGRTVVSLTGNFFYDNDCSGFYFNGGGENTTMTGNLIVDNRCYGIEVHEGVPGIVIQNNFLYNNHEGIGFNTDSDSGGENAFIDSNVIANSGHSGIWAYHSAGHTITNNAIGGNDPGIYMYHSWNSLIAGNEIGRTTLDGSLFKLSDLNLPFGFNTQAAGSIPDDPSDMMLDGNDGQGVLLYNVIPGMGAETAAYSWIEVNRSNADDWDEMKDDSNLQEAAIGFDFPITYSATLTSTVYTHFQVISNGAVELLTGQGQADDVTDYEGRGYFADNYPDQAFLFANVEDWIDYSDIDSQPTETHNGVEVKMNGWGYRHFTAGETDGDGNVVAEECLVFRWYVNAIEDGSLYGRKLWNDFQAIIYPDGRIRWNVRRMDGRRFDFGRYAGLYAGSHDQPLEIQAGWSMDARDSYLFDPKTAREVTTQVAANNLSYNNWVRRKNGGAYGGVALYDSDFQIIRGNVISYNFPGVMLYGDNTHDTMIKYNDFYCAHMNNGSKQPSDDSLVNDTNNPVDATKNYWYTNTPGDCIGGDYVNYTPWLTQAIPPTDDTGVLLADPTKICAAGGVITVTGRLYPGTIFTIPEMAVDAPITFTVGDMLPMPFMPPGIYGVGIPIALGPTDTVFSTPAMADIPYSGFGDPNAVFYYIPETGKWATRGVSLKGVNTDNKTASISIGHLTTFAAALLTLDDVDFPDIIKHNDNWYDCYIGSLASGSGGGSWAVMLVLAILGAGLARRRLAK